MAAAFNRAIAAVAGPQYGYITRAQLLAIGLSRRAIHYRVEVGQLIPVHAGVYGVGHVNVTPVARASAAVLACGKGGVLSHGSAATLWGFNKYWDMPFEVTVATSHRRRGAIKVHRSRTLVSQDITHQLGVRVTTPERTVLDVAPRLTSRRLSRVVNDARHAGFLHLNDLADVLDRNPHHPGTSRLRSFVANPGNPTRSPLEDDFLEFAKRYGLPTPVTNTHLLGYEVDVLYPEERLVVEVDSHQFHSDRQTFEGDRNRDVDFLAAGIVTVRITDERMNQKPEHEASRLNKILAARRKAG